MKDRKWVKFTTTTNLCKMCACCVYASRSTWLLSINGASRRKKRTKKEERKEKKTNQREEKREVENTLTSTFMWQLPARIHLSVDTSARPPYDDDMISEYYTHSHTHRKLFCTRRDTNEQDVSVCVCVYERLTLNVV